MIDSTVDYLIQHDKNELKDLLKDFKDEVGEDFTDIVLKLEELVDVFVENDILENERVADSIEGLMRKLEASSLPKSKLLRFKMLINDIGSNRHRIREILTRLMNNNGEEETVLNGLQQAELLSDDQRHKIDEILSDKDCKDLQRIADVIKTIKIGRGIKFLPRKTEDLVKSLQTWLEELKDTGNSELRKKVSAVLNELLNRRGITKERYDAIKMDNNIL